MLRTRKKPKKSLEDELCQSVLKAFGGYASFFENELPPHIVYFARHVENNEMPKLNHRYVDKINSLLDHCHNICSIEDYLTRRDFALEGFSLFMKAFNLSMSYVRQWYEKRYEQLRA